MRRINLMGLCLMIFLLNGACVSTLEIYQRQTSAMYERLSQCMNAKMTKSELIMRVGPPTVKEIVEDGEIWIYQLSESGETISKTTWEHELFSSPTATTTSTANNYKATITLHLNNRGILDQYRCSGQYGALCSSNNPFLNIDIPER